MSETKTPTKTGDNHDGGKELENPKLTPSQPNQPTAPGTPTQPGRGPEKTAAPSTHEHTKSPSR